MNNCNRKKILISAYACLPDAGSEPGMGWNWVSRIAEYHDVWLLTEENRYAPVINKYIEDHPHLHGHLHVVGIPRERFGENIWSHLYYWSYRQWQLKAYKRAVELQQEIRFDLVHQLNMIGYREPGFLWKLPVPFIWGPVGGHTQMLWNYLTSLGLKGAINYGLRNILNAIQMRVSVRVKNAAKSAKVLLAATKEDKNALETIHKRQDIILLNEQGTNPGVFSPKNSEIINEFNPIQIAWCGLFLARKALPLALHAIQLASKSVNLEFHIMGTGPCLHEWKQMADKLNIQHLCCWHGHVEHQEVLRIMNDCDVFLFTSLQEGTPAVVMEAMQMGLPVICHDMCGFGESVNESCGIKIMPDSPKSSILGFADAIIKLATDSTYMQKLQNGAKKHSDEISWDNKVSTMLDLYENAHAKNSCS